MSKYIIELPELDGIVFLKGGYIVKTDRSILINTSIKELTPAPIDVLKATDKRFEEDYIRRWRVLAMLRNIRNELDLLPMSSKIEDIKIILNNYIKFAEEIDEKKWEEDSAKL